MRQSVPCSIENRAQRLIQALHAPWLVEPKDVQQHDSYYRGRTEARSTKISLSICAVTGSSSLRDELPISGAQVLEMNRQPLKNLGR
jgi:hypothetical protein